MPWHGTTSFIDEDANEAARPRSTITAQPPDGVSHRARNTSDDDVRGPAQRRTQHHHTLTSDTQDCARDDSWSTEIFSPRPWLACRTAAHPSRHHANMHGRRESQTFHAHIEMDDFMPRTSSSIAIASTTLRARLQNANGVSTVMSRPWADKRSADVSRETTSITRRCLTR